MAGDPYNWDAGSVAPSPDATPTAPPPAPSGGADPYNWDAGNAEKPKHTAQPRPSTPPPAPAPQQSGLVAALDPFAQHAHTVMGLADLAHGNPLTLVNQMILDHARQQMGQQFHQPNGDVHNTCAIGTNNATTAAGLPLDKMGVTNPAFVPNIVQTFHKQGMQPIRNLKDVQPGSMIIYQDEKGPNAHVGIYDGNGYAYNVSSQNGGKWSRTLVPTTGNFRFQEAYDLSQSPLAKQVLSSSAVPQHPTDKHLLDVSRGLAQAYNVPYLKDDEVTRIARNYSPNEFPYNLRGNLIGAREYSVDPVLRAKVNFDNYANTLKGANGSAPRPFTPQKAQQPSPEVQRTDGFAKWSTIDYPQEFARGFQVLADGMTGNKNEQIQDPQDRQRLVAAQQHAYGMFNDYLKETASSLLLGVPEFVPAVHNRPDLTEARRLVNNDAHATFTERMLMNYGPGAIGSVVGGEMIKGLAGITSQALPKLSGWMDGLQTAIPSAMVGSKIPGVAALGNALMSDGAVGVPAALANIWKGTTQELSKKFWECAGFGFWQANSNAADAFMDPNATKADVAKRWFSGMLYGSLLAHTINVGAATVGAIGLSAAHGASNLMGAAGEGLNSLTDSQPLLGLLRAKGQFVNAKVQSLFNGMADSVFKSLPPTMQQMLTDRIYTAATTSKGMAADFLREHQEDLFRAWSADPKHGLFPQIAQDYLASAKAYEDGIQVAQQRVAQTQAQLKQLATPDMKTVDQWVTRQQSALQKFRAAETRLSGEADSAYQQRMMALQEALQGGSRKFPAPPPVSQLLKTGEHFQSLADKLEDQIHQVLNWGPYKQMVEARNAVQTAQSNPLFTRAAEIQQNRIAPIRQTSALLQKTQDLVSSGKIKISAPDILENLPDYLSASPRAQKQLSRFAEALAGSVNAGMSGPTLSAPQLPIVMEMERTLQQLAPRAGDPNYTTPLRNAVQQLMPKVDGADKVKLRAMEDAMDVLENRLRPESPVMKSVPNQEARQQLSNLLNPGALQQEVKNLYTKYRQALGQPVPLNVPMDGMLRNKLEQRAWQNVGSDITGLMFPSEAARTDMVKAGIIPMDLQANPEIQNRILNLGRVISGNYRNDAERAQNFINQAFSGLAKDIDPKRGFRALMDATSVPLMSSVDAVKRGRTVANMITTSFNNGLSDALEISPKKLAGMEINVGGKKVGATDWVAKMIEQPNMQEVRAVTQQYPKLSNFFNDWFSTFSMFEKFRAGMPHMDDAFLQNYLLHKYRGFAEYSASVSRPDGTLDPTRARIANSFGSEFKRTVKTLEDADRLNKQAMDTLEGLNTSKDKFLNMLPEQQYSLLRGANPNTPGGFTPGKGLNTNQQEYVDGFIHKLLMSDPVTDPGTLAGSYAASLFRTTSTRNFVHALRTTIDPATGGELLLLNPGGSPSAAPGGKSFTNLSAYPMFRGMNIDGHPATDFWMHPAPAEYMQKFLMNNNVKPTEFGKWKNLWRGYQLMFAGPGHWWNMWGNALNSAAVAPAQAVGLIANGQKFSEAYPALVDFFEGHGLNLRAVSQQAKTEADNVVKMMAPDHLEAISAPGSSFGKAVEQVKKAVGNGPQSVGQSPMDRAGNLVQGSAGIVMSPFQAFNKMFVYDPFEASAVSACSVEYGKAWNDIGQRLMQNGFSRESATKECARVATEIVNQRLGALSDLRNSGTFNKFADNFATAPSWFRAKVNAVVGSINPAYFKDFSPQARNYMQQQYVGQAVSALVGGTAFINGLSYLLNGHGTMVNPPDVGADRAILFYGSDGRPYSMENPMSGALRPFVQLSYAMRGKQPVADASRIISNQSIWGNFLDYYEHLKNSNPQMGSRLGVLQPTMDAARTLFVQSQLDRLQSGITGNSLSPFQKYKDLSSDPAIQAVDWAHELGGLNLKGSRVGLSDTMDINQAYRDVKGNLAVQIKEKLLASRDAYKAGDLQRSQSLLQEAHQLNQQGVPVANNSVLSAVWNDPSGVIRLSNGSFNRLQMLAQNYDNPQALQRLIPIQARAGNLKSYNSYATPQAMQARDPLREDTPQFRNNTPGR